MKKQIKLKPYIIATIISIIISAGIFSILVFALKQPILDGLAIPGVVLLAAAGLIYISREGFFDFASYGFKQLGNAMFGKNPTDYKDLAEYKIRANEVRKRRSKYYLAVLGVGLVLFVVSIIILIINN